MELLCTKCGEWYESSLLKCPKCGLDNPTFKRIPEVVNYDKERIVEYQDMEKCVSHRDNYKTPLTSTNEFLKKNSQEHGLDGRVTSVTSDTLDTSVTSVTKVTKVTKDHLPTNPTTTASENRNANSGSEGGVADRRDLNLQESLKTSTIQNNKVTDTALNNLNGRVDMVIKSMSAENAARFKMYATLLRLKYHEFQDLLLANFAESNPTLESKLTNQTFNMQVKYIEPPKTIQTRSLEADRIIKTTKEIMMKGTTEKVLVFRCDNLLRPLLQNKTITEDQRQDVLELINKIMEVVKK